MDKKILIIEGNKHIATCIRDNLARENYVCTVDTLGFSALNHLAEERFDLIILDILLLDINGLLLCKEIRNISSSPIIILSELDDIKTKVTAFDYGANDYLTKPFNCQELAVRLRALLYNGRPVCNNFHHTLTLKDLLIDLDSRDVYLEDERISLTNREFNLLAFLIRNKNTVLSRDQILEQVWGYDFLGTTNVVDVYIRYIRSKLRQTKDNAYVATIRGIGYMARE